MRPANCLNCGEALLPDQRFCSRCGQKTALHRISLHEVAHDAMHYFTHADKGIFHLLQQLATRPGKTAREFIAGRRKHYFPPLNFFLIVAALCLFVSGIAYQYQVKQYAANRTAQVTAGAPLPANPERTQRIAKVNRFFAKYSNIIPMAATPVISLLMWLFYIRGRYSYAEHLVANLYIVGFTVLVYSLVFIPLRFWAGNYVIYLFFLFEIGYRTVSYYYLNDRRSAAGWLQSAVSNIVAVACWFFISGWARQMYINNGFGGLLH